MIVHRDHHPGRAVDKDFKRWCKGKIGRGHDYKLTKQTTGPYTWLSFDTWTCTQCGKGAAWQARLFQPRDSPLRRLTGAAPYER